MMNPGNMVRYTWLAGLMLFLSAIAAGVSPPAPPPPPILKPVAMQGDGAPGFENLGLRFSAFGHHPVILAAGDIPQASPRMDRDGNVGFHGYANDTGVPETAHPYGQQRGMFRMIDGQLQLVVKVGDPAPGLTPGVTFTGFIGQNTLPSGSTPMVHGGTLAFYARTSDHNIRSGVWTDRFGDIELIVRDGTTHMPGTPIGQTVFKFAAAMLSPSVWVYAQTSNSVKDQGLWHHDGDGFQTIMHRGFPAPGTEPGVVFDAFTSLAFFGPIDFWDLNSQDEVIFNAYLGPASAPCGNGVCEPLYGENCLNCPQDCNGQQSGNPAQQFCCGGGGGENPVDCSDPRCSSAGFNCDDSATIINVHNDEGIWFYSPKNGGLRLIVREGDPAPQVEAGATFGNMNPAGLGGLTTFGDDHDVRVRLNDNGAMLFGARVTTPEYFSKSSIWTTRNGELELYLTGSLGLPEVKGAPYNEFPGDVAPWFDDRKATFRNFLFADLSNDGHIAFIGRVILDDDPLDSRRGIWWDVPGEMSLVAAVGQPVPGVPGAVFTNLFYVVNTSPNWKHVSFVGVFSGAGIPPTLGFFRATPDNSVDLIFRPGQTVHIEGVGDRVLAPFTEFDIGIGQSDAGDRAFHFRFTDGTTGIVAAPLAPASPTNPGDLNNDGVVDVQDLLVLLGSWGACADCGDCPADINGDCSVDVQDMLILLANWGPGPL